MIAERSVSTIPLYDRWTVVLNDPFLPLLNDLFHRFTIVEWSVSTIPSYDRWKIGFNHPFVRSLNNRFQRSFFNDRWMSLSSTIFARSFSTIPIYDRWMIVVKYDRWTIVLVAASSAHTPTQVAAAAALIVQKPKVQCCVYPTGNVVSVWYSHQTPNVHYISERTKMGGVLH